MKLHWPDDDADTLSLNGQKLTSAPGLERYQKAVRVWLGANRLDAVPPGLADMPALRHLTLDHNPIDELPEAIAARLSLWSLRLDATRVRALPPSTARWPLLELSLSEVAPDFAWREALARLDPARLTSLSLGCNPGVAEALDLIPRFTQLKVLHLNQCGLRSVPESFAALTQLETLSLYQNDLADLPEPVLTLPALRSLVVGKNPGARRIKAAIKRLGRTCTVT